MMFRVVQFNMQFGQIWDDADPDHAPIDIDATVEEIRSHDADIVLLQEVEHAQPGGVQPEPPPNYARLRSALSGYDSYFSYPKADSRELPFGIGLAIFSKTPLYGTVRIDLPSPRVEFEFRGETRTPTDRLLIGARTALDGRELNIFNTHLLALFMLQTRTIDYPMQRRQVLEVLATVTGPTVFGGDFNAFSPEGLVEQFGEAGYRTVQISEGTWRRDSLVLDYVFFNDGLKVAGHNVKPTPASDHHVLVADFEFAGA
jgi:endonuclease/exonuclease/phosphatase (EEP) superfamily protein YafD